MTAMTTSPPAMRTPKPATLATIGVGLAAVVIFAGNYNVPKGESGGTDQGTATAGLCAIVAVVLFGLIVPRVRKQERAALALGIVTVLSIVVFWSGVTPILAAATLAVAAREPVPNRRTSVVRWLSIAVTVLAVGWTLANSHLF